MGSDRRGAVMTMGLLAGVASLCVSCTTTSERDGGLFASGSGGVDDGLGEAGEDGQSDGAEGVGTDGAEGDDDGDDDAPRFDVAGGAEAGGDDGASDAGCRGIDFLFVVDNSGSMADEQANLTASVPAFLDTMRDTVDGEAESFQIMVVPTDADVYQPNSGCGYACEQAGNPPSVACNGIPCDQYGPFVPPPPACRHFLGTGRVSSHTGTSCGLPNGQRFISSVDTNVDQAFPCVADVGVDGSGLEKVAESMTEAVGTHAAPGECNEGFLRDDALLVVTLITDEDEGCPDGGCGTFQSPGSAGNPALWYDDLVAAKGGSDEGIVVLGLIGDLDLAASICQPFDDVALTGAEPSPVLRDFVGRFGDHGMTGSVCAPDYGEFFADAVALIDTACDEFIPPG